MRRPYRLDIIFIHNRRRTKLHPRTLQYTINEAVLQSGLSTHKIVTVQIFGDLIRRLPSEHRIHLHEIVANAHNLGCLNLYILGLSPRAAHGLVDHDARAGEGKTLALRSGGEDERGHGCGKTEIDRDNLAFDELHGVEDSKTGDDRSTGAVYVEVDGFGAVFFVKIQHHTNDLVGELVIDFRSQEDDALSVKAVVNIHPVGIERKCRVSINVPSQRLFGTQLRIMTSTPPISPENKSSSIASRSVEFDILQE